MNSGPVTAGVLRGERARLQLFGDTVNTTARIETTGLRDRIHVSAMTANLLKAAGHEDWLVPREEIVSAKGKGKMNTFWLKHNSTDSALELSMHYDARDSYETRIERLVDWNTELLMHLLKNIVAHRNAVRGRRRAVTRDANGKLRSLACDLGKGCLVVDEVANIIELPEYNSRATSANPNKVVLPSEVAAQCRAYIARVASMYRDNPFHNFEVSSLWLLL